MSDQDAPPKARGPNRVAVGAALVLACALALIWRQLRAPERLAVFAAASQSYPVGVVGEELIVRRLASASLDIRATPLRGGAERSILTFDAGAEPRLNPDSLRITRRGVFCQSFDPVEVTPLPPRRPEGSTTHATWPRRPRMRLWRLPLSGGKPQEIMPERRAVWKMAAGDYCYWLESPLLGDGQPLVTRIDDPPQQKLWAAPLAGGPARSVAVLGQLARVAAGTHGVFWATEPGPQADLVYARPPSFSLAVIPKVNGYEPPREVGDRLYWLDGDGSARGMAPKAVHQVVSAAADGSDRRVEMDAARGDDGRAGLFSLSDDGASLLVQRVRELPARGTGAGKTEHSLCRIRPGRGREPEVFVRRAPDEAVTMVGVDAGFVYYTALERRENWLDWSASGLRPRLSRQFYRARIPR